MPAPSSRRAATSVLAAAGLAFLAGATLICPLSGCDTRIGAFDGGTGSATADAGASPLASAIAQGQQSARSRGCTSCHDAGDGTPAGREAPLPGTRAYPSNLTSDFDTGLGAWSDEQIARAVRDGVDEAGRPLCEIMPRYARLDGAELHALVMWIRSLPAVRREIPRSQCQDAAVDAAVPDLGAAMAGGADAALTPDDLTAPCPDLATQPDLAARPADLAMPRDLSPAPDLSVARDLAAPRDLVMLPDGPRCSARINEVQTAGLGGAGDEFIELFNPCPGPVDLDGGQIVYRSAAGIADVVLLKFPVWRMAPGGRVVLGSMGYTGVPDLRYGGGLAADGGGLALREPGGALGDHLGWGTATNAFVRLLPAVAPPAILSIGRHPDGLDSGLDLRDFLVNLATPGGPNR